MDKNWVQNKNEEYENEFKRKKDSLISEIKKTPYLVDEEKAELLLDIQKEHYFCLLSLPYLWMDFDDIAIQKECKEWTDSLPCASYFMYQHKKPFDRYLDTLPREFDGDIIITDPCYIIRKEHPLYKDDWDACCCGDNMEVLGIRNYMVRDTIYGDWSCITYNLDTDEEIGSFCADAGLVGVFHLDEVLNYNPEYNYKDWSVTHIKNFIGTVQFVVVCKTGAYEEESDYHKKGEPWEQYDVEVVGYGKDKLTGEFINFVTRQTGY